MKKLVLFSLLFSFLYSIVNGVGVTYPEKIKGVYNYLDLKNEYLEYCSKFDLDTIMEIGVIDKNDTVWVINNSSYDGKYFYFNIYINDDDFSSYYDILFDFDLKLIKRKKIFYHKINEKKLDFWEWVEKIKF